MRMTLAHWNQLASYIQSAEMDGWYYGNKANFRKRHEEIKKWVIQQAITKNKPLKNTK